MAKKHYGQPELMEKLNASIDQVFAKGKYRTYTEIYDELVKRGFRSSEKTWSRLRKGQAPYKPGYRTCFALIFDDPSWLQFEPRNGAHAFEHAETAVAAEPAGVHLEVEQAAEPACDQSIEPPPYAPADIPEQVSSDPSVTDQATCDFQFTEHEIGLIAQESAFRKEFGGKGSNRSEREAWLKFRSHYAVRDCDLRDLIQNNLIDVDDSGSTHIKLSSQAYYYFILALNLLMYVVGVSAFLWDTIQHWQEPLGMVRFTLSGLGYMGMVWIMFKYTLRPLLVARQLAYRCHNSPECFRSWRDTGMSLSLGV